MFYKSLGMLALAALMFGAVGCLVVKGNSTKEEGVMVSSATLNQVQPGETSAGWLRATLGEPTSSRKVDEHTEILRYDHKVVTEKGGAVFLIFAGGERHENTKSVLFELKDGIVARYWTEG